MRGLESVWPVREIEVIITVQNCTQVPCLKVNVLWAQVFEEGDVRHNQMTTAVWAATVTKEGMAQRFEQTLSQPYSSLTSSQGQIPDATPACGDELGALARCVLEMDVELLVG